MRPMFDAEIFGITSSQFLQFALTLIGPTVGFVFLYLLSLPLNKLPFVEAIAGYKPPGWLLPTFALGSLYLLVTSFSIAVILWRHEDNPNTLDFLASFVKFRAI